MAFRRPRHRALTSVSGQKLSAGRGSEQVIFGRLLLRQSDQAVRRPQRNLRRIGRGRRLWPCAPEWLFPESVPVRGGVATTLLISKQGWQCRAVALSALLASSDEPFLRTAPSGRASGGIRGEARAGEGAVWQLSMRLHAERMPAGVWPKVWGPLARLRLSLPDVEGHGVSLALRGRCLRRWPEGRFGLRQFCQCGRC